MAGSKGDKIYDYFKSEDFVIYGKHADYVDDMWTLNTITDKSRFVKLVDLYAVGAMIGIKYGLKAPQEPHDDNKKRTVQLSAIANEYRRFMTLMQMMLILDESRGLPEEDRVKEAFDTSDKSEEVYRKNMDLFNSYARGGIEYLHQQLCERAVDIDDEFEDYRIANMVALLEA